MLPSSFTLNNVNPASAKIHENYFICYIDVIYYNYYMQLKILSRDSLDDGWNEPTVPPRPEENSFSHVRTLSAGDTVLYRTEGQLTPAVLVAPAGGNCWLARDARHANGLIYLGPEHIKARLPRMDLLEEAA